MKNEKILYHALTFDDVLLVPDYSEILPSETDLSVRLTKNILLKIPVLSAAMDTVTEAEMAIAIALEGGMGIIHKNMTPLRQAEEVQKLKSNPPDTDAFPRAALDSGGRLLVGAAVGAGPGLDERLRALYDAGVDLVVVDSAHGHSRGVLDAVKRIKDRYPELDTAAGNIVTGEAAVDLAGAGADVVKVGVGPGSICTTRIVAGVGVPQISAVMEVAGALENLSVSLIADGGIRYAGDITKALAAGAHAVMLGGLLAGTVEAPGEMVMRGNKRYKSYVGMGSRTAMERGSKDRYFQSGREKQKLVPEGIEAMVPVKGKAGEVLYELMGGLRAGMGYCGTPTVEALRQKGRFVRITPAGMRESHPHDVIPEN